MTMVRDTTASAFCHPLMRTDLPLPGRREGKVRDIYSLTPEELSGFPVMPGTLDEALDCLEEDHEFLLKGDVFTEDALETWLDYKRENEVAAVAQRPHPHEFELYYDV